MRASRKSVLVFMRELQEHPSPSLQTLLSLETAPACSGQNYVPRKAETEGAV